MITLGRINMDESAMGSTNETSFYGATKNPWNPEHVPGGSPGDSAAVVATCLAPAALGLDTGGSTRQPVSHCGITGTKPTYGTVSRFDMVAYTSSSDQVGPMAQIAEDCVILLNAMVSFDERDSTSLECSKEDYTRDLDKPLKGMRIGLPKEYFGESADADAQVALQNVINLLRAQGTEAIEVSLPQTALSIPVYYVLASVEASTNLSRYDGVHYGHRVTQFSDFEEIYNNTRVEGPSSEAKRRIMIGTYVLSHGYYDAYYLRAQKLRRLTASDFQMVFVQCDFILAPTAPTATPELSSDIHDPVQMYLSDIYTIVANLAGLPALTLPVGLSGSGPLIGVQFIGNHFFEARILGATHQIQLESDWHTKTPDGGV